MARLKKNGNLSGAIGNIVFVNDGDRSYVRSRPGKVRQTKNTKAAASVFGWVSTQEKLYRIALQNKITFQAYQYFAARHMATLKKTVSQEKGSTVKFQDPTALTGFDFNQKQEWNRCTNFFPSFDIVENMVLSVGIPALAWGRQIKAPKNADRAILELYAISTDLNQKDINVEILSSLSMIIKEKEPTPSQEWSFGIPANAKWLLIIGIINFDSDNKRLEKTERSTGTYLWSKGIDG